jgi:hypothetical protein
MSETLLFRLGWSGFSLVFVVLGLYTANRGRVERARSKQIATTETTPIRNLEPGTVEIKGTAHPTDEGAVLNSPIERANALATYVKIEEWEHSNQSGGNWKTKHEKTQVVPMIVEDDTGQVRVDLPRDGDLIVEETQTEVAGGEEPPEAVRRYVEGERSVDERDQYDLGPISLGDRRRYSEGWIEPGEEVYVLGNAREKEADWGERVFVIDEPDDSDTFVLSDKSEDDLIQEGKWGGRILLAIGGFIIVIGALFTVIPWVIL